LHFKLETATCTASCLDLRFATIHASSTQGALLRLRTLLMRGAFPREGAALKVTYLALRNLEKWNAVQGWKEALNRFALVWEARFPHQCV
jgi:transposase-like protein